MAQRSIPALPKTCIRKMPSKAALLKRTRAQRIPFRPGDRYSNKGRIHSRRPILSFSFFACKTAADHTFRVVHNTAGTQKRPQRCSPRLYKPPLFFLLCPTRKRDMFSGGRSEVQYHLLSIWNQGSLRRSPYRSATATGSGAPFGEDR